MKTRVLTAVVLVPLLLAILFAAPKILTAILFSVLCALAVFELLYCTGLVRHVRLIAYSVIIAALVPIWCYYGMDLMWGHAGVIVYFALLFSEMMLSHVKLRVEKLGLCVLGALLMPYLLSSPVRIMMMDRLFIMVPFIAAFMADSGAYFVGIRYGQRKLAPAISPKKTVEGALGGIVVSILSMLVYTLILQLFFKCEVHYGFAVIYGLIGAVGAVFGDLCFSVIKRQTGVKDFGRLFPGHGGVLDRFDSMVVVSTMMELLLVIIPLAVR